MTQIKCFCIRCSEEFIARSSKAKYCSNACKQAYHRLKSDNPIDKAVTDICNAILSIIDSTENNPDVLKGNAVKSLAVISDLFSDAISDAHYYQCVRSGQHVWTDKKPNGKCKYCKDKYLQISNESVKARYKGKCTYKFRVAVDRNQFATVLSDYSNK